MNVLPTIQHDVPLAPHTTLGVGGSAKLFVVVHSVEELRQAISFAEAQNESWIILGGGSNVLVSDVGYDGLVIKMAIAGITEVNTSKERVELQVGAGMHFDSLVAYTVEHGWWGLENLSSIPGTVGATPVQNVGAYGVEISHVVTAVEVYDTHTNTMNMFTHRACQFAYRTSIFKQEPNRYIITAVTFSLSLLPQPQCSYADLARYFEATPAPSLTAIRQAVQKIRAQKFPDWTAVGTAGSFFKNPIVPKDVAQKILEKYPELPHYPEAGDAVKLSLGHILDKVCGLKGYTKGAVGLYEKQAMVLVVEKNTPASAVIAFSNVVMQKVFTKTGITIEREVTIL